MHTELRRQSDCIPEAICINWAFSIYWHIYVYISAQTLTHFLKIPTHFFEIRRKTRGTQLLWPYFQAHVAWPLDKLLLSRLFVGTSLATYRAVLLPFPVKRPLFECLIRRRNKEYKKKTYISGNDVWWLLLCKKTGAFWADAILGGQIP